MRLLTLTLALVLLGCKPQPQQEAKQLWFDLPDFINELVLNMSKKNHPTTKTFSLNSKKETKEYNSSDSTFWARELAKMKRIDLNSPQVRDVIAVKKNIEDDKSNLLITEFLLADNNLTALRKLKIYYLADTSEIRHIYAELESNNIIEKSATKINLWLNRYDDKLLIDSLETNVKDQTLMQSAREYSITTRIKW